MKLVDVKKFTVLYDTFSFIQWITFWFVYLLIELRSEELNWNLSKKNCFLLSETNRFDFSVSRNF